MKDEKCRRCMYKCWYSDCHSNDPCYCCKDHSNFKEKEDSKESDTDILSKLSSDNEIRKGEKRMSNDTKACWKDRSPFSSEDNKESMLKAFELFGFCMAAGPCNNCIFFDRSLQEDPCAIGCPNSWPLFDTSTENGTKNRNLVLDALRRKEEKE